MCQADCSSTPLASRFTARRAAQKGGLGQWYRPDTRWPQLQTPRHLRPERQAVCPACNGPETLTICASPRLVSSPCRHRLNWLATRVTTVMICANGWPNAAPGRSYRPRNIARSNSIATQRSIGSVTSLERMFCRFKDWRRVATRFDRNIKNLHGNNNHRRNRHLVAVKSPDPNMTKETARPPEIETERSSSDGNKNAPMDATRGQQFDRWELDLNRRTLHFIVHAWVANTGRRDRA